MVISGSGFPSAAPASSSRSSEVILQARFSGWASAKSLRSPERGRSMAGSLKLLERLTPMGHACYCCWVCSDGNVQCSPRSSEGCRGQGQCLGMGAGVRCWRTLGRSSAGSFCWRILPLAPAYMWFWGAQAEWKGSRDCFPCLGLLLP